MALQVQLQHTSVTHSHCSCDAQQEFSRSRRQESGSGPFLQAYKKMPTGWTVSWYSRLLGKGCWMNDSVKCLKLNFLSLNVMQNFLRRSILKSAEPWPNTRWEHWRAIFKAQSIFWMKGKQHLCGTNIRPGIDRNSTQPGPSFSFFSVWQAHRK